MDGTPVMARVPQDRVGNPCSQDRMGYPQPGQDVTHPSQDRMAYPPTPPVRSGWGTFPETEQLSKYLLGGGWYASCIHARGLSFLFDLNMCSETLGRITALREEPHSAAIATCSFLILLESLLLRYMVYPQNPTGQGC